MCVLDASAECNIKATNLLRQSKSLILTSAQKLLAQEAIKKDMLSLVKTSRKKGCLHYLWAYFKNVSLFTFYVLPYDVLMLQSVACDINEIVSISLPYIEILFFMPNLHACFCTHAAMYFFKVYFEARESCKVWTVVEYMDDNSKLINRH